MGDDDVAKLADRLALHGWSREAVEAQLSKYAAILANQEWLTPSHVALVRAREVREDGDDLDAIRLRYPSAAVVNTVPSLIVADEVAGERLTVAFRNGDTHFVLCDALPDNDRAIIGLNHRTVPVFDAVRALRLRNKEAHDALVAVVRESASEEFFLVVGSENPSDG